ncbi:MAG: hypothetical protein V4581_00430 [Bacteroidota bacterium]
MKEYIILSGELFNIKKGILNLVIKRGKGGSVSQHIIMFEMGRQLRFDLEQLKIERFLNVQVSVGDQKLIKKINERIMVKYAIIRRSVEREIAAAV